MTPEPTSTEPATHAFRKSQPAKWLFGVVSMPYGSFNGIIAVALPYLLRQRGVPVSRIATYEALVQAPAFWYFLWAPAVDLALRRRTWITLLGVLSGVTTAIAFALPATTSVVTIVWLLVAASACNQPISSAVGGLMASSMPSYMFGRAAGWSQAGTFAAGVIGGGIAVWFVDHEAPVTAATFSGLLILAPAILALTIPEAIPIRRRRLDHLRRMFGEVTATLRRRSTWIAAAFFLSPVSAGALMNLFSAVAVDFKVSATMVIVVVGVGGVCTVLGALAAGQLLDHFDRRLLYAVTGLLTAAVVAPMCFAPLTPLTYAIGACGYAFATGFGFAAYTALALELVGSKTLAASSRFTIFAAAVNVPVIYMLRLDGYGNAHFGVRGLLATDAIANGAFGVLLLVFLAIVNARKAEVRRQREARAA